ncbi:hypothetical protein L6164_022542 [Bauhinia variegata]|uniref:Uncharacterized protein n=1 Tax=Bauhinia variegata TaxID=167791 RepID=A0ACB9MIE6_BAUVA|nr:hypothetical protein L6164_022542 [Bauhinia variegata]
MCFQKNWSLTSLLPSFCVQKGLSFFAFGREFVLEILADVGIIRSRYWWLDVEHIEEGYQNMLVCVEMVFFSVYQQYDYSAAPYRVDNKSSVPSDKKKQ